jgi:DNA-binding transcriptional MerR regulator
MKSDGKMTITKLAEKVGVVPKTIVRWEKAGKIKAAKKNWRGWRIYTIEDLREIRRFYESLS